MNSKKNAFNIVFVIYFFLILYLTNNHSEINAQNLPVGYIEQFSHTCSNESFFYSFTTNHPVGWKTGKETFLRILPVKNDSATYDFSSKCVLDSMIFGEYIIEFEFKPEILTDTVSYFAFLSPVKSANTYNAMIISKDTVTYYLIDKGNLKMLDKKKCVNFKPGWNKIRIHRDILTRNTSITINNIVTSKLVFNDRKLVMGYLGFAAGNSSVSVRNIKIWAPTSITDNYFKW